MPVTLISSPDELPADPPPGLFVLMHEDPANGDSNGGVADSDGTVAGPGTTDVAVAVAEMLGSQPPCAPAEAAEELRRRDLLPASHEAAAEAADPAEVAPDDAARQSAIEDARGEAAEALARVPSRARGVAVGRLQSAAAAVRAAEQATLEARTLLGERPELPAEAADAALVAEEALTRARQQRTVAVYRSSTLLVGANAAGILIIAGRIRTQALEPVFVLVAVFPLIALLHLAATFVSSTRQAHDAAQLRTEALRSAGMATMTGLAARNARLKAWAARAEALASAEAALSQARRRWTALAGTSADPSHIGALLRTMAEAERTADVLAELEGHAAEAVPGLDPEAPVPDADPVPGLVPSAPASEAPLVVLVEGPDDLALDDAIRTLLESWDEDGTTCAVVVVTACSEVRRWAESRTVGVGAEVVDLRERVLASLDRLRARAASFGNPDPPSSMAADG